MCNQTTSKVIKVRPIDAVKLNASAIAGRFNSTRQRPGKTIGTKIVKGDTVMVLDSHAVKKKGAFYKSYRDHWSKPLVVQRVQGHGIFIDGKSYPRNRVKKVQPVDKDSINVLEKRPKKRSTKEKEKPKRRERSTRATKKLWSERKP